MQGSGAGERAVLAACASAFSRWICGPVRARPQMRPSKFEARVLEILRAFFGPELAIVREVVLPVRVDGRLRRLMDDLQAGEFQLADVIELRIDFAYLDSNCRAAPLRLIEVDGSQHAAASHFFHGLSARSLLPRALRRDMLKDAIIAAAPGVRLLRLGPECERDSHAAKVLILRRLAAFASASASAAAFASSAFPPLSCTSTIPSPDAFAEWAAAARGTAVQRRGERGRPRRRCKSAPPAVRRHIVAAPLSSATTSAACKARTAYNRHCKEVARRRLAGAALDRTLARITQRQVANDSRKRPRDDAGFVYEPKWFKAAARAHNKFAPVPMNAKQQCALS
jgi:hypothetical protein